MKKTIGFCGACIAFYIGAGFATMQEVMQYEASYGSRYWIVVLVTALVYIYTNISFATNGNISKIERGGEIFSLYCGKKIGAFYDAFCAFFCYMCFIVMCGGANSTATEQWNRILLDHHPENYDQYTRMREIDLILSGHNHGGQIRLLGKGVYARNQGLFPKYDGGIFDNRLIVSRGLSNTLPIPRFWNPIELVYIDLLPRQKTLL